MTSNHPATRPVTRLVVTPVFDPPSPELPIDPEIGLTEPLISNDGTTLYTGHVPPADPHNYQRARISDLTAALNPFTDHHDDHGVDRDAIEEQS